MEKQCLQCQKTKEVKWFTKTRSGDSTGTKNYYREICKECEAENRGGRKIREVIYRLSDVESAYMAGLFDGEGHVGLYKRSYKSKKRVGAQGTSYNLRVQITSTDKELIEWLLEKFDGLSYSSTHKNIPEKDSSRDSSKWKPMLQFIITGRNAVGFMKAVLPYLRIKKERVLVALCYIDTIGYSGMDLPDELVEKRKQLYNKMRELNKRGI